MNLSRPFMSVRRKLYMKRPIIGLIPLVDEERESYWMLPGYMDGVRAAGGIPVMLPLTSDEEELRLLNEQCDGYLLTGGQDVAPGLYGEQPLDACGRPNEQRDAMEKLVLDMAVCEDKAVLGICRGIQFMNVALGGTLYQDIPTQRKEYVQHHQNGHFDSPVHMNYIEEGTPLCELLGTTELAVNSYHHQAIKSLAPKLCMMACSEDGLVEAVYMPDKRFVWGVQWHPEFSYKKDEHSMKIFEAFTSAAGRR